MSKRILRKTSKDLMGAIFIIIIIEFRTKWHSFLIEKHAYKTLQNTEVKKHQQRTWCVCLVMVLTSGEDGIIY